MLGFTLTRILEMSTRRERMGIPAHRERLPGLIMGLLQYLGPRTPRAISDSRFHAEIRRLSEKHPELFKGFAFSKHSSDPYSECLAGLLWNMKVFGMIGVWEPDRCWEIRGVSYAFSRRASLFTAEEIKIIEEEGKALAEKVVRGELAPVRFRDNQPFCVWWGSEISRALFLIKTLYKV